MSHRLAHRVMAFLTVASWMLPRTVSFVVPTAHTRGILKSFQSSSAGMVRHVAMMETQQKQGDLSKSNDTSNHHHHTLHKEYAALSPGSTVRIQVGDVTLARKAWKKRRRSGSPLLVPCSVLDVDRTDMVRRNVIYLLQKFGTPLDQLEHDLVGFRGSDVAISMSDISKLYKQHLGTSLAKHAKAFDHETARSLVRALFDRDFQKEYGIRIWVPPKKEEGEMSEDGPLWLMVPLSRQRAHRMAAQAGILQFAEALNEEEASRIGHTGIIRARKKDAPSKGSPHEFLPLSAAMRVNQRDLDTGMVQEGSIYSAVVFSFDLQGDGGSPLLTVSLSPSRGQVRDHLKMKKAARGHFSRKRRVDQILSEDIERRLEDLKVGDGPLVGKVTRLSTRSGAAFVDCGVGRTVSQSKGGGTARVLGMLRFDDLVYSTIMGDEHTSLLDDRSTMTEEEADLIESAMHDDEEEDWEDDDDGVMKLEGLYEDDDEHPAVLSISEDDFEVEDGDEDVTHLVLLDEDGRMVYTDPDTGIATILNHDHDDSEEDDEEDDNDHLFSGLNPEERIEKLGQMLGQNEQDEQDDDGDYETPRRFTSDSFSPSFIKVGDDIDVYVKSVLKQSGRFIVTVDPSVKGRKAKDLKRESEAERKLSRLLVKMGGQEGYKRIVGLEGTVCEGVVKATSKTGDWFYVQPSLDGLPVGVAELSDESLVASFAEGDSVRVRLEGIDESRGQLAMTIIS